MYCTNCGKEIDENVNFAPTVGKKIPIKEQKKQRLQKSS